MSGEPKVVVFDVRDVSARSGHQRFVPMAFAKPFPLGKVEHFDARIASGVLTCAIDRFNWSAITYDEEARIP